MEDLGGQFGNASHGDVGPLAESPIKFGRSQKSENFSDNAVHNYWNPNEDFQNVSYRISEVST